MNQLYAGVTPVALEGESAASALKSNVHTYEVALVLTKIKEAMLEKVSTLWLDPKAYGTAPAHDGLFVSGGSIANLYSLILAREKACQEAKKSKGRGRKQKVEDAMVRADPGTGDFDNLYIVWKTKVSQ